MPKNRVLECHTCLQRVRSDLLKTHCKKKHGMSDEQLKKLRNYSCQYCKKHFSRSINCRYHEIHCKPKSSGDLTYRDAFQFSAGTENNGDCILDGYFKVVHITLMSQLLSVGYKGMVKTLLNFFEVIIVLCSNTFSHLE